jgi:hypothetical protein
MFLFLEVEASICEVGYCYWNVSFTFQFREQSNQLLICNRTFEHFKPLPHKPWTNWRYNFLQHKFGRIWSTHTHTQHCCDCDMSYVCVVHTTTVVTGIRKYASFSVTYNNDNTHRLVVWTTTGYLRTYKLFGLKSFVLILSTSRQFPG